MNVRVLPTPGDVAAAAASTLEAAARDAAARGAICSVALAGGSTPQALHALLAGPRRDRIAWHALEVFFGDERTVPPEDPASNWRQAHETLLSRVPVAPGRVHRLRGEAEDLDAAAREYEACLRERVPRGPGGMPSLDLVWLGLGEDGHTASLFPGTAALEERERWVVPVDVPQLGTRRLTLTYPVLNAARHVQLLVTGVRKAAAVRRVEEAVTAGTTSPDTPPAARVRPRSGQLEWLLDRAAAGPPE